MNATRCVDSEIRKFRWRGWHKININAYDSQCWLQYSIFIWSKWLPKKAHFVSCTVISTTKRYDVCFLSKNTRFFEICEINAQTASKWDDNSLCKMYQNIVWGTAVAQRRVIQFVKRRREWTMFTLLKLCRAWVGCVTRLSRWKVGSVLTYK